MSKQPYVKVTTQLGKHELSGFWQYDRNRFSSNRERDTHDINPRGAGGSMYQAKLNSVWGNRLQTSFSASYNNKGGAEEDTYEDFPGFGPSINVHQSTSHLRRRADRQRHPRDDEQRRNADASRRRRCRCSAAT